MSLYEWIRKRFGPNRIPQPVLLSEPRELGQQEFAALCCYFNPQGYQSRRENYAKFYREFKSLTPHLPLFTVELAIGDRPFELSEFDSVIQIRTRDVLWHKEALLNYGIRHVAQLGFKKVAWLDADIRMTDPAWPQRAAEVLDRVSLCQLFSESVRMESAQGDFYVRTGVAKDHFKSGKIRLRGLSCGYAWAAKIESLLRVPLYDAAIMGGGDAAIFLGALCSPKNSRWIRSIRKIKFYKTQPSQMKAHYLKWAKEFGREFEGKVGYIPQTIYSMYHGKPSQRSYQRRYRWLKGFDPEQDLERSAQAPCWSWSQRGQKLAQVAAAYFERRKEDDRA